MIRKTKIKPFENKRDIHHHIGPKIKKGFENWGSEFNGNRNRYEEIYRYKLKEEVSNFILNDLKKHPEVMILGPGIGYDTAILKKELESIGIKPTIDVLNIFKSTLDKKLVEKKIIREDLSREKVFEHINSIADSEIINKVKGKYDVIVAPASVGYYSTSPPYTLFQTALMLSKKGRAFVEVALINNLKKNAIEKILKIAPRMIEVFNKTHNLDLKYEFSQVKGTYDSYSRPDYNKIEVFYVRIQRKK